VSFEKSNGQILEIKKSFEKSNEQIFGNQRKNLRNQMNKFEKSKKPFEESNEQILEIKTII